MVRIHHSRVHGDAAPHQVGAAQPSAREGLVPCFEEEPLLWVHGRSFGVRDAERAVGEAFGVCDASKLSDGCKHVSLGWWYGGGSRGGAVR